MKSTSSLKRLPTSRSIGQEKEKFLVIILCEDQNVEFQQFCLDIYDQSLYIPDNSLAKIQIVESYEEFLEIQKQTGREYFILSSEKAIEDIYDVINVRQKWVIYDSSKKGSFKRIHDLPNVVYRTRQIQSLREKLESRRFISKQRLINQKYRRLYQKQLQKERKVLQQGSRSINVVEPFNNQKTNKSQRIEKSNEKKISHQQQQNNAKKQKKIKIIKSKSTTLSSKLIKTQKQITPISYSYDFNKQTKLPTEQFYKNKSNQIFTSFQPISDYESQLNLHLLSKNQNSENKNSKLIKESKIYSHNQTNSEYFPNEVNDLKIQHKNSILGNNYDSPSINSVKKNQQFPNNNIQSQPHEDNQQKFTQLKTQNYSLNKDSSELLLLNSVKPVQNVDDYEFQKVVPSLIQNNLKHKNNPKKHKIKFDQLQDKKRPQIPLPKEKSISLNYFSNRIKISDSQGKINLKKVNLPKNPIQMKLHHSKSELKNRSILSASKSLNSKGLTSSKQNFGNKKKSSEKLRILQQKYFSKEKFVNKDKIQRRQKQEMSTIESEENMKSPLKSDQLKIFNKGRFKKSLFLQNSQRKSIGIDDYEQTNNKQSFLGKQQQLSALYLVDNQMPQHLIKQLQSLISFNDSVYRFKNINQLKNQIKQSENVFQLIFVFNQKPLSDFQIETFQKINPSSYFVTIDTNINNYSISKNQIKLKNLDNFQHIISSIILKNNKQINAN